MPANNQPQNPNPGSPVPAKRKSSTKKKEVKPTVFVAPKNRDEACRQVWQTLSAIDCSEHTENKQGLTYLSWAWAYKMLMDNYPDFTYDFFDVEVYRDDTVEVGCTVSLTHGGHIIRKSMWLPVMSQARGKAIVAQRGPDALAISNCKMRCLTKAISMLGLGSYIYAGEDLPTDTNEVVGSPEPQGQSFGHQPPPMPAYGDDMANGAYQPVTTTSQPPQVVPQQVPVNVPAKTVAVNVPPMLPKDPPPVAANTSGAENIVTSIKTTDAAIEITDILVNLAQNMHSDSMQALAQFWRENKGTIDALDNGFPEQFARLRDVFTSIKNNLLGTTEKQK